MSVVAEALPAAKRKVPPRGQTRAQKEIKLSAPVDPRGGRPIPGRPHAVTMDERISVELARSVGRKAVALAMQVWVDGLKDTDKWFRAHCAKEIANRCGLPVMTETRGQLEISMIPIMAFGFANSFPEAIDVEAEPDTRGESVFPKVNEGEASKSLPAQAISCESEGRGEGFKTFEAEIPGTSPPEAKTPQAPETPPEVNQ